MELIEFAEKQGEEAVKFSLSTLELNRARCHTLLALLLGGAGAMAGLGIHAGAKPWVPWLALSVSVWWFALAAYLALRGLRTSPVWSWTSEGVSVLKKAQEWQAYTAEVAQEGSVPPDAFAKLREQQLGVQQAAAEQYRLASTQSARALDHTYLLSAFTPLSLLAGALLYRFLG